MTTVPDEQLSAYLTGDLPDEDAARVEAALATDPAAAHRLEQLELILRQLGGTDEAIPPPDLDDRILAAVGPGLAPADTPVASLAAARRRRAGRRRWAVSGAAAAAVVLLGIAGVGMLGGVQGAGEEAAMESAPAPAADAPQEEDAPQAESYGLPEQPLVVDSPEVDLAGPDDVRRRYADLPEVTALEGLTPAQARRSAEAGDALAEEAPLPDGTPPDACTETLAPGGGVIARVERLRYQGEPALAHVTVAPVDGTLTRGEVWVLDPGSCATLAYVVLP